MLLGEPHNGSFSGPFRYVQGEVLTWAPVTPKFDQIPMCAPGCLWAREGPEKAGAAARALSP